MLVNHTVVFSFLWTTIWCNIYNSELLRAQLIKVYSENLLILNCGHGTHVLNAIVHNAIATFLCTLGNRSMHAQFTNPWQQNAECN